MYQDLLHAGAAVGFHLAFDLVDLFLDLTEWLASRGQTIDSMQLFPSTIFIVRIHKLLTL